MKYILLHGMGQNASSWDKTISYLSDKAETIPFELSEFFGGDIVLTAKCMFHFVNTVIVFPNHLIYAVFHLVLCLL
ncbi:MAG: hypothetical protein HFH69_05425 [Lachnospiraceae bacterium]|nr:hypothetical protein [Lachnospiraceae bacterium]